MSVEEFQKPTCKKCQKELDFLYQLPWFCFECELKVEGYIRNGVAAVILSIGMAVDANILIFERMKDELRSGRTMLSAINIGFNRAWPAIRDGNVSTLITCAILYWFSAQLGATIVQGFAVTLAIGVLISMISAIVISRSFLRVIAATPISRNLRLFLPSGGKEISS